MRPPTRHRQRFETRLDMTPLIDCVFQLILFLILASQVMPIAEDIEPPFALEGRQPEPGATDIVVNVVRDDEGDAPRTGGEVSRVAIVVDGRRLSPPALGERLARAASRSPAGVGVLVRADREVPAGDVGRVLAACARARIHRVRASSIEP